MGSLVEDGTPTLHRAITVFRRQGDDRYERSDEQHVLRLYEPAAVAQILERAGFSVEQLPGYGEEPTHSTPPGGWTVFVGRRR